MKGFVCGVESKKGKEGSAKPEKSESRFLFSHHFVASIDNLLVFLLLRQKESVGSREAKVK